ncbi:MAG: acetyl/propionyl/methylcrotonyl-CoA carboxylase subunit alpha [Planctomycetota bacterium]
MNSHPFSKVLIANRGEIALRIIRACREMGLASVAVYSEPDRESLHVRHADEAVALGGKTSLESYLRIDKLIAAAKATGAGAIHPGYGFLSERAEFAQAVMDAGLVFIGPPPSAIKSMGDKTEARRLMKAAGMPMVPGSEGAVNSAEEARKVAKTVGYPVMLKARAGGGGKGIRRVEKEEDLEASFRQASSEAQKAFGDGALYLEKVIYPARHVEIQVFADAHGNGVHLNERECSLQRRSQKLVEETPSLFVTPELRKAMTECSVKAALSIGYVGAGTMEFLVGPDRKFYFIEMNTRLQVEHTVTEMVTGLDLVREQLRVALGEKLSFAQKDVVSRGHSIQIRVCCEDPHNNFSPSTGVISSLQAPGGAHVRFDSSLYEGQEIGLYYDPMVAKLVVWGATRDDAVERLRQAVQEFHATGIKTSLPVFLQLADDKDFRSFNFHTRWLEDFVKRAAAPDEDTLTDAALCAVALAHLKRKAPRQAPASGSESGRGHSGWRQAGLFDQLGRWR